MDNKEKVKYILSNYRKARAKGHNLIIASKSEYSLQAKVAVGGTQQSGKSDSEQEKYISRKEEDREKGQALLELSQSINLSIESLPQRERIVVELKHFEELTEKKISRHEKINRTARQVRNIESNAVDLLVEYGLPMIYDEFKQLLS